MGCLSSKKKYSEVECVESDLIPQNQSDLIPQHLRAKGSVLLTPVKQDTVYDAVIENMVKEEEIVDELQNQRIIQNPEFEMRSNGNVSGKESEWLQSYTVPDYVADHPCCICFRDSKYGISTECKHFYCVECIKQTLEAMVNSGQFPAYCPQCRAESLKGTTAEPIHGRIEGRALSFLQQRGVITKEFQFRFMKQMREGVEEYFECPDSCGNFLIHQDPEVVVTSTGVSSKPGQCICGALVCCSCHKSWWTIGLKGHKCPTALKKADSLVDNESLNLMENLGKPCPMCGQFCMKNGGCNIMMCGTNAHGKVEDALKGGGCGHQFFWESLRPCSTYYYYEGKRVKNFTGDLRPGKGGKQASTWREAQG